MPEKKLKIKAKRHEISLIEYENQNNFINVKDIAKRNKHNDPRCLFQNSI